MNDLIYRTATDLAEALRARRVSSRELTEAFIARRGEVDGDIGAVVTADDAGALAAADAADRALADGQATGPLCGVPITVKDTFETAGLRTTAGGFAPLAEHVPSTDAVSVARLRAAGAVLLGKTNAPQLAGDVQTYNPIFGVTRNPWDGARTCGGSSGGSAAALAAGLSALELGSDIGGSIRHPAHWCGVYGLKPTHDIIPVRGHVPGPPGTLGEPDLAVVGPMARSAEDLDLALDVMAGPLPDRARAWRLQLPPPRHASLAEYRVGVWMDDDNYPVDAEVAGPLRAAIESLRDAGARIDDDARPDLSLPEIYDTYLRLVWPILVGGLDEEQLAALAETAATAPADAYDAALCMARYGTERHLDWLRADEVRHIVRARMAAFFERYDLLLMPINPLAAIVHDHSAPMAARSIEVGGQRRQYLDLLAWIAPATMAFLPAVSAPVGLSEGGLPVGMQIVAPYLEDRTAIDFARRMADVVGGFVAPPL